MRSCLYCITRASRRAQDDLRNRYAGLRLTLRVRPTSKHLARAAQDIQHAEKGVAPDPREAKCDAVAFIHDELEAGENASEVAHDEHGCGPRSPCDGAWECDEREDGDMNRMSTKSPNAAATLEMTSTRFVQLSTTNISPDEKPNILVSTLYSSNVSPR